MKQRGALISLAVVTLFYLAMLWVGHEHGLHVVTLIGHLPLLGLLMALTAVSWLLRYARWHLLLHRQHAFAVREGLPAYLAGFALTATPGKAGELVRIRYFQPLGVPAHTVMAAFLLERGLDLLTLLALASIGSWSSPLIRYVAVFSLALVSLLLLACLCSPLLHYLGKQFQMHGFSRTQQLLEMLDAAVQTLRPWLTPSSLIPAACLGMLSWSLMATAFVVLVHALAMPLTFTTSLALYPLAMLAGAASLIPGGLGTTEAAIFALLTQYSVAPEQAILAAVIIRLSTLWFAIGSGLACMSWLEWRRRQDKAGQIRADGG